jgi:flagellar hook-basal body complex protein FliE
MSFAQMLEDIGNSSLNQARSAETISANALQGKSNISDVVAAISNAEVTLQTVLSVRDRVVSGIQEIMRMPV